MASICARQSAAIPKRFAQANARRGFSTRSYMCQEVRDAYILSAARTPTAKVSLFRVFIHGLTVYKDHRNSKKD